VTKSHNPRKTFVNVEDKKVKPLQCSRMQSVILKLTKNK